MASSVTYIPPVVALFIGLVIAKEAIALTDWLGMAIILVFCDLYQKGNKLYRLSPLQRLQTVAHPIISDM